MLIDDLGGTRLRRLTPDAVEAAFKARAAAGVSHSSFIKIRSVLGCALEYAQRRQLVTTKSPGSSNSPLRPNAPKKGAR